MKILITGGAGFVGSSLAESLAWDDHKLFLVDDLSTGKLENLSKIKNFSFFEMDLANKDNIPQIESVIKNVDLVYHFAASIGVKLINNDPSKTFKNSSAINDNLFPLFEKYNKKVIYSSTSEVYGETSISGADELSNMSVQQCGRGSYAASKIYAEFMLRSYTFPYVITRFFNVVGPNQTGEFGHVFPKFIECAGANQPIPINGTGGQVRSYCDIRDAIEMLKLLMDDKHNGEIYNIGSEQNVISVKHLAETIVQMFKSSSTLEHIPIEKDFGEILLRVPDMSKMNQHYKSIYDLKDIICHIGENKCEP